MAQAVKVRKPAKGSQARKYIWNALGTLLSLLLFFLSSLLVFGMAWGEGYRGYTDKSLSEIHSIELLFALLFLVAAGLLVLAVRFLLTSPIPSLLRAWVFGPFAVYGLVMAFDGYPWLFISFSDGSYGWIFLLVAAAGFYVAKRHEQAWAKPGASKGAKAKGHSVLWIAVLIFAALWTSMYRSGQRTTTCLNEKVLMSNRTIQEYGSYRSLHGNDVLELCASKEGLLTYRLIQDGEALFGSDPIAAAAPMPGTASPALIASKISVYHKWGMRWDKGILWIYSGDVGCFSWRKVADKYQCQFETCETSDVGPASTILGEIYNDTHP